MTDPVVFRTVESGNGKQVGVVTLNVPKTLNSLSLAMIDLLDAQLRAWQSDDAIAMVVLDAEGDKAFCAGGDIVKLYQSMTETPDGERNTYAPRSDVGRVADEPQTQDCLYRRTEGADVGSLAERRFTARDRQAL